LALKGAGVTAVVAKSFARIFFRNAINTGLPLFICDDVDKIKDGAPLEIDRAAGTIYDLSSGESYTTTPLPQFLMEIVDAGGLVEYTKRIIATKRMSAGAKA
jgi:3-isopropylmalate/(R)-2-methylmalate dehydratase small subunit